MYPGLSYVGTGKFAGLYGCNETIIDQKAIGLQHLFIDDYSVDMIHTACSVLTIEDTAFFGDRIKPKKGHALRQKVMVSTVTDHCIFEDTFCYQSVIKTDRVTALNKESLYFETEILNNGEIERNIKLSALCITQNQNGYCVKKLEDTVVFSVKGKYFAIKAQKASQFAISLDAPSGFMYKGIEDILYDKQTNIDNIQSDSAIAVSLSEKILIKPNQKVIFKWVLLIGEDEDACVTKGQRFNFTDVLERSVNNWREWLKPNYRKDAGDALVALKAANLNGFLPADLTGHYFANQSVCFYVRDALMASRAFLYSGHYEEFESIIVFLMSCPVKENGEFFQRYNADHLPDEGANNNVFSQIDAIGYFARVIADYYHLTDKLLVTFDLLVQIINALEKIEIKNNLFGPEGGVNEGVYGPAYITSTNMFIAGGLLGAASIARKIHQSSFDKIWTSMAQRIIVGTEAMFISEGYYAYGYVDYHDDLILRYDTPQLLSASLGYPLTDLYKKNFDYLSQFGTYFGHGYGYSEQEYHNGPWVFNTAAAAQVAYLTKNDKRYDEIMKWLYEHRNAYGLFPEAIDARNEFNSFINPLMWANAEYVCCCYIDIIMSCRGDEYECSEN